MRNRKSRSKHGISLQEYRNTAYMYVRRGEDHPCAKLTPALVRQIRQSDMNNEQLAQEIGISRESVRDARNYTTWRSVK